VLDLIGTELLIGVVYLFIGYSMLRFFEVQGRSHATLDRS
jgi:hypothetical protein